MIVPLDAALGCLEDDEEFMRSLERRYGGFNRSLPKIKIIQRNPHLAQFFKKVLVHGKSEDEVKSNAALDERYRRGWLQAELLPNGSKVYIFPSKLHERYKPPNDSIYCY